MQKWEKLNKEDIANIIKNSSTKTEVLKKLGYLNNGHTKIIDKISQELNIDITHLIHESIIGKRYGMLTVVEKSPYRDGTRSIKYLCKCDCGNIKYAVSSELNRGRVLSCGCLNSKGEQLIGAILAENNITYTTQFTFVDLNGVNGGKLKFDFAIFENDELKCLIEYQGEQHYKAVDFYGGQKQFDVLIKNDKIKEEYCINNKIKLIKIPYQDFNEINFTYLKERIYGNKN